VWGNRKNTDGHGRQQVRQRVAAEPRERPRVQHDLEQEVRDEEQARAGVDPVQHVRLHRREIDGRLDEHRHEHDEQQDEVRRLDGRDARRTDARLEAAREFPIVGGAEQAGPAARRGFRPHLLAEGARDLAAAPQQLHLPRDRDVVDGRRQQRETFGDLLVDGRGGPPLRETFGDRTVADRDEVTSTDDDGLGLRLREVEQRGRVPRVRRESMHAVRQALALGEAEVRRQRRVARLLACSEPALLDGQQFARQRSLADDARTFFPQRPRRLGRRRRRVVQQRAQTHQGRRFVRLHRAARRPRS
jgi:hypothetical protein